LREHPVSNNALDLLEDSKIVVGGGAHAAILEWHLNRIQELAGDLPDVAPALFVLQSCVSHFRYLGSS